MSSTRVVFVFGLFGLGAVVSVPVLAQPPSADRIVAESMAKYASLKSYSDEGEVIWSTSEMGAVGSKITTTFRTTLARPAMYSVAWSMSAPRPFHAVKGAIWSDGQHRSVDWVNRLSHPRDDESAISYASFVSFGAARTIPTLFLLSRFPIFSDDRSLRGEESIEGDDCYVLMSTALSTFASTWPGMVQTVWISKASKLIRRVSTVSETVNPPKVERSDADAREALDRMVQEATPEAIRKRLGLPDSVAFLDGKTFTSVETHRNIRIDEPLTEAYFQIQ